MSNTIGLSTDSIFSEITVPLKIENSMEAKFLLYGVGKKEADMEVTPRLARNSDTPMSVQPRALASSAKLTEITSIYRGNTDILTSIQPRVLSAIPTTIEVRPHTRMQAIYEIKKPPIMLNERTPIEDAFTKKENGFQTINYGKSSTLVMNQNDNFESFIRFENEIMERHLAITKVELELIYQGEIKDGYKINLHEAGSKWSEYGITYKNKPSKGEFITSDYQVDKEANKILFDLTDVGREWLYGRASSNGIIISTNEEEVLYLKSRESYSSPRLLVSYYDTKIPSTGRSQLRTELFVVKRDKSEVLTEVEVGSTFSFSKIPTEIYVHRSEVPVDNSIESSITTSKPSIATQLSVVKSSDSSILTSITARSEMYLSEKNMMLSVSRPSIETEIMPRLSDKSSILSEAYISRKSIETTIVPRIPGDYETFIIIEANDIHVSYLPTEITARLTESSEILTVIESKIKADTPLEITSSCPSVPTELTVSSRGRNKSSSSINTSIFIVHKENKDLDLVLFTSRKKIDTVVTARQHKDNDIPSEIIVRESDSSDILTEIYSPHYSNVPTVIDIVHANMISTEIVVSKDTVQTIITVPYHGDSDTLLAIQPRILYVGDKETIITVGKSSKGYVFIY